MSEHNIPNESLIIGNVKLPAPDEARKIQAGELIFDANFECGLRKLFLKN